MYLYLLHSYLKKNWLKVIESVLVAACSAVILVVLIYSVPNCAPIKGFVPENNENNVNVIDY